MVVVITKNGKPVDAFFNPNLDGYLEIEQDSLVAKAFAYKEMRV